MPLHRKRSRIRVTVAVVAVAVVAAGIGIGTADASTRPRWAGNKHPKPSASAPASASVSPSPTPTATKTTAPAKTTAPTTAPTTAAPTTTAPATTAGWAPPPANGAFDYQIGAAYTPPTGVTVVSRDYTASPAAGIYNICYVNAFQAQTDALSWWKTNHSDLLLHDASGNVVIDKDWDEALLDYSTAAKRTALTTIVGGWIDTCASKGFKAIEPDNLDSYSRSNKLLTEAQAVAYAASLSSYAHGKGLAVAQKNDADLGSANAKTAGFDFAVAEECADYDECGSYTATYGNHVIVIEYTKSQFTKACSAYGSTLSIVLRDVDVTAPGSKTYVSQNC